MHNKYPDLPWDSDDIRELRVRLQKPERAEDPEAFYLHRRISIYITIFLAHWLPGLHPNHLTLLAVLLAFLTPIAASLLPVTSGILLMFIAYHIVYILDLIDGELARYTGHTSQKGVWLDRLLAWGVHLIALATYLLLAVEYNRFFVVLGVSSYIFRWSIAEARISPSQSGAGGKLAFFRWLFSPSGLISCALIVRLIGFEIGVLLLFPIAFLMIGLKNVGMTLRSLDSD